MQMPGYSKGKIVTPHDTNQLAPGFTAKAIYVGGAGNITMQLSRDSAAVLFTAVPVGVLPVAPIVIMSTGTAATAIMVLGD